MEGFGMPTVESIFLAMIIAAFGAFAAALAYGSWVAGSKG
jgi:hypothetical protein